MQFFHKINSTIGSETKCFIKSLSHEYARALPGEQDTAAIASMVFTNRYLMNNG